MLNKLKKVLQNIIPNRGLTKLAGWGAQYEGGWLTKLSIILFIRIYKIDMEEAREQDISTYRTFNEFFVRLLREDSRPINNNDKTLVFPADGIISQIGRIDKKQIFQAKGHIYSIEALLAGNDKLINKFQNGSFSTIYLSLRNYHRVHMPCNGTLREMMYVPGDLFSLHPNNVANIPNLFARNERIICLFDTDFGPMIQILIGAAIVGSIETVWSGVITPPREGIIKRWFYPSSDDKDAIVLLKGKEMGRFKLGSTVINLFSERYVSIEEHLYSCYITRIGQKLAHGYFENEIN